MSSPNQPYAAVLKNVLARYRGAGWFTRAFVRVRHMLCPMRKIVEAAPRSGRMLDVGCGHGLFSALLAVDSPQREVTGVDPAEAKIAVARACAGSLKNVRFVQGMVQEINDGPYDTISILDVLYLLPEELAVALLRHCRTLLADGGTLLLKTNDVYPRWKYSVVLFEEWLMVKLLGYTHGGELHFRSADENQRLLAEAGFVTEKVLYVDGWRPVPHRLFVCRPKVKAPAIVEHDFSAPAPNAPVEVSPDGSEIVST